VKEFAGNANVAFGDVNLRDGQIPGPHNPGAGGWPTIRYFNSETGVNGGSYVQKTSQSMCDELGPKNEYLKEYISDKLPKCFVASPDDCSEKEKGFIQQFQGKTGEEISSQLTRLEGMQSGKMKPELKLWLSQRIAILKQLQKGSSSSKDEL